jgi:hypothetical protein
VHATGETGKFEPDTFAWHCWHWHRLEEAPSTHGGPSISLSAPWHLRMSLKPKNALFRVVERSVRADIEDRTLTSCHATIHAIANCERSKQCAEVHIMDRQPGKLKVSTCGSSKSHIGSASFPDLSRARITNCYAYAMKCHTLGERNQFLAGSTGGASDEGRVSRVSSWTHDSRIWLSGSRHDRGLCARQDSARTLLDGTSGEAARVSLL